MAAMKYFLVTRQADESRILERYKAYALRDLQAAIERCGPENGDAIIAASILMMEGAQDWQQWTVYLAGYSAVSSSASSSHQADHDLFYQVLAMNLPTNMPEIRSSKFILQLFPRASFQIIHTLPHSAIRSSSHSRVATLLQSLVVIKPALLTKEEGHSSSFEFRNIEILGESLRHVHRAESLEDVFGQFVLLKSWMFCMELRTSASKDVYGELGAKVVRLHFYGFLEAMIPYFPPTCRVRLNTICGTEIPLLREEVLLDGDAEVRKLIEELWD